MGERTTSTPPKRLLPPSRTEWNSALFSVFPQIAAMFSPRRVEVGPTQTQTDLLAVVLAHELSHLLLSHSLEGVTSSDMYETLGTITSDSGYFARYIAKSVPNYVTNVSLTISYSHDYLSIHGCFRTNLQ